jgi:hypothetical protein
VQGFRQLFNRRVLLNFYSVPQVFEERRCEAQLRDLKLCHARILKTSSAIDGQTSRVFVLYAEFLLFILSQVFEEMTNEGVKPNFVRYNFSLHAYSELPVQ